MNILQICLTEIVESAGGVERVFCNLANHFCENHNVTAVCVDEKEGKPFYHLNKKVNFINLGPKINIKVPLGIKIKTELVKGFNKAFKVHHEWPKHIWQRRSLAVELSKTISDINPDVIFCYSTNIVPLLIDLGVDERNIIMMFHSKIDIQKIPKKEIELLKKVRIVQVLLPEYKQILVAAGFENVEVIGNYIDDVSTEKNIHNDGIRDKFITYIGRIDKHVKRPHILVDAFTQVADTHPEWKLKIIGGNEQPTGYLAEIVESLDSCVVRDRIEIKGIISNVYEELYTTDILVNTSSEEGFGLSVLEALSCGVPVIGFEDCTGVNCLVQHEYNGILCKSTSNSLAEALDRLMTDTRYLEVLQSHTKESAKEYSKKNILAKWDDIIQCFNKDVME